MEESKIPIIVVLGTMSEIKIKALTLYFSQESVKFPPAILCTEVKSCVSEQPVGQEQTQKGAEHRARKSQEVFGEIGNYFIGIENGMWKDNNNDKWVDGACICVISYSSSSEEKELLWSATIEIPDNFPQGQNGEWSMYKDPHKVLTKGKRTRAMFLADALSKSKLLSF